MQVSRFLDLKCFERLFFEHIGMDKQNLSLCIDLLRAVNLFKLKFYCAIEGTMEQKIFERQLQKTGTSLRVVDEHQVHRNFC